LRSITDPKEFQRVEKVLTDTSAAISAEESFQYYLKVKAVRSDGRYVSLSNELEVEFQHDLFIPNVITPNQDGFNDTFEIENIRLYPQNRLVIFNRYGKSLHDETGYQGKWDAGDLSSGIYYFILIVPEKSKEYKGWLNVVR
jgi:gliding motility-associated-like protein